MRAPAAQAIVDPFGEPASKSTFQPSSTAAPAVVDDFDAKLTAQKAKQKEFSFGEELGKGVKGAIKYTLPSMAEQVKLQGSSDAFLASQKRLELMNKIDSGVYKNLNEIQDDPIYQALKNDGQNLAQVNGYFSNRKSPEIAAKLRGSVQKDFDSMALSAGTSIDILNKYTQENKKKYGARVEKFTDINWTDPQVVADFTNWLGYNMGSAGVQLAPIMIAGLVAKSPGVLTLSSAMETAGAVQNRMEFITNKVKDLPPGQQAAAISKYVAETGDTNLILGLVSGSFDLVLGPTASIVKTSAKQLLEQMSKKGAAKAAVKQLPKDILHEAGTGALQESTQIAGKKSLGEEGKRITGQNIKDVINAAAAEAAGAPVGTAINVARDVYAASGAPEEEAGQTITEPTLDTAAPLAPTPAAGGKEPTIDDTALAATPAAGGKEPTIDDTALAATPAAGKKEPVLDDAALLAAEGKPPQPFDDAEKVKTEQIVKRLLDSGYPTDSAQRIAVKQVLEARKKVSF